MKSAIDPSTYFLRPLSYASMLEEDTCFLIQILVHPIETKANGVVCMMMDAREFKLGQCLRA